MLPFLRWPGGKQWLASSLVAITRRIAYRRYVEPFLGAGALFFALEPPHALISDVNAELINMYRQVRRVPKRIQRDLGAMPVNKRYYLQMRASSPNDPVVRAVRFLYLNRTAFSGLYRVNRFGQFNVPYGGDHGTRRLCETPVLQCAAAILRTATLRTSDFEQTLDETRAGDLVYCDPTYTISHNQNAFVRYNEKNFSWSDQIRLEAACRRAYQRGATVIVSNACHPEVARLYSGAQTKKFSRTSLLAPDPARRTATAEYLFAFANTPVL